MKSWTQNVSGFSFCPNILVVFDEHLCFFVSDINLVKFLKPYCFTLA